MSEIDVAELRQWLAEVPPLPWAQEHDASGIWAPRTVGKENFAHASSEVRAFIVATVNALPALLEAVGERDRLRDAASEHQIFIECLQEWAEAWTATHGLTFTGSGPFPEIERRDEAEVRLITQLTERGYR